MILLPILLATCSPAPTPETRVIRIAVIPTEDSQEQLLHLKPLADYLSAKTGFSIEFQVTTNYTAAIEALRADHVQMAWLGPFSYVLAAEQAEIVPVVGGIRKDTGGIFYNSIILVRKDSGIVNLQDLRGHTFAFIDPASTSGYLFPLAKLIEEGINPESDFSNVVYAGSHTAAEFAISNGQVDAAADSLPSYELMVRNNSINPDDILIIWKSEPIPPSPLVARKDLGSDIIQKIQEALTAAAPEVISFEGELSGYAPVQDSDYNIIRQVARKVGLLEK